MDTHLFTIVPNADMWHANDFAFVVLDAFDGTEEYGHIYTYADTFEVAVKAVCDVCDHFMAAPGVGFPLDDLHTNLAMSAWYREDQESAIAETVKEMQDEYDANPAFDFYKNRRRSTDVAPHATPNALFRDPHLATPGEPRVFVTLDLTLQEAEDLRSILANAVKTSPFKDVAKLAEDLRALVSEQINDAEDRR